MSIDKKRRISMEIDSLEDDRERKMTRSYRPKSTTGSMISYNMKRREHCDDISSQNSENSPL